MRSDPAPLRVDPRLALELARRRSRVRVADALDDVPVAGERRAGGCLGGGCRCGPQGAAQRVVAARGQCGHGHGNRERSEGQRRQAAAAEATEDEAAPAASARRPSIADRGLQARELVTRRLDLAQRSEKRLQVVAHEITPGSVCARRVERPRESRERTVPRRQPSAAAIASGSTVGSGTAAGRSATRRAHAGRAATHAGGRRRSPPLGRPPRPPHDRRAHRAQSATRPGARGPRPPAVCRTRPWGRPAWLRSYQPRGREMLEMCIANARRFACFSCRICLEGAAAGYLRRR